MNRVRATVSRFVVASLLASIALSFGTGCIVRTPGFRGHHHHHHHRF
ncbi:MAG: hypothetical protein U0745_15530 [Polyangia bacterium]|jgi:hypothetical protein